MYLGVMSSKDWIVTVGGVPVIGLAEDSNVTVEMADDQVTVSSGIGGDWSFVDNPTNEAAITFVTQRNSPANAALFLLQKTKAVVPVSLMNTRNLSRHVMAYAMIARMPTDGANNGTGAQTLEWRVVSGDIESVINGTGVS